MSGAWVAIVGAAGWMAVVVLLLMLAAVARLHRADAEKVDTLRDLLIRMEAVAVTEGLGLSIALADERMRRSVVTGGLLAEVGVTAALEAEIGRLRRSRASLRGHLTRITQERDEAYAYAEVLGEMVSEGRATAKARK